MVSDCKCYLLTNPKSATGRLYFSILSAFAQHASDLTSERTSMAMRHIAEQGKLPAGGAFGYQRNAEGSLVPHPQQAPVVREVFRRVCAGETIWGIVRWLNEADVPRKLNGREWHHCLVTQMVRGRLYRGEMNWGGQVLPAVHEPLVSPEDWEVAQVMLASRQRKRGKSLVHFTPLFRCGLCGGHVKWALPGKSAATGQGYLGCASRKRRIASHDPVTVNEDKAMAAVYRHTELLLSEGSLEDAIAAVRAEIGADADPAIPARLAELARLRQVNLRALMDGLITQTDFAEANAPLMAEEATLRATQTKPTVTADSLAALDALACADVAELLGRIRGMPVAEQVEFLKGLYPRIEVFARRLVFHHLWGEPVERELPRYWGPQRGVTRLGW